MKQGCGGRFRPNLEQQVVAKIDAQIRQRAIFVSRLGEFLIKKLPVLREKHSFSYPPSKVGLCKTK